MKYNYKIGDVIDDLEIIDSEYREDYKKYYECKCKKCGRRKMMLPNTLFRHSGTTHKACGKGLKTKDKKFYSTWQGLKSRIYNPNYDHYDRYGGRGLICDYDNFIDFYDDMYESFVDYTSVHGTKDVSIDRINNDMGYVRGNLRWANQKTQVNNSSIMRTLIGISPDNKTYVFRNITEFAAEHNLKSRQISSVASGRFKTTHGWRFKYVDNCLDENGCINIEI